MNKLRRIETGLYEAKDSEGNIYHIHKAVRGWNVYKNYLSNGYLFSAATLEEVKICLFNR